ncbi:MAG: HAMP domain-containing histidine kinase [Cyclobacteriaceae bacterium]|nr:HAMP domain-containing histidine kinase [Cyclobacteriaceae bacterium]MDH4295778.1 HAMP domain-containing histidine kinase [Cyclobacteriaceae bacterium]MDH5247418.1 HAMP domain-containing histidine kinase [Cyclobacteriaceae bacterium]
MGLLDLSENSTRLFNIYFAEVALGLIFFFIFRHFGTLYRRRFLLTWSWSWMAYSVYSGTSGIILIFLIETQSLFRDALSIIAQLACFLQIIMILRGTYELIYEKAFSKRKFRIIFLFSFGLALFSVTAFGQAGPFSRYLVSFGSRAVITGLGFLVAGIVVWTNKKFSKGFGQQLLSSSLILFSVYQLYDFMIRLLNILGTRLPGFELFGIVDLLLISLMGMSMVMWFLEDERGNLDKENKELDSFLSSTSHDLRTPIASILGLTYLGKLELKEEKARSFMSMIEERIKKLDLVISDILSLSRSKKIDLKIEELDFARLLEETIADIRFNKGASAIKLEYQPDPSHVFRSDYNQMKIILNNLMANAVKYHDLKKPNPYIRVSFKRVRNVVEIAVKDNGKGISKESIPKIFDMFYRDSPETEGTGLGLYIIQEALIKIKGIILVDSELGKGSMFKIVLDNA